MTDDDSTVIEADEIKAVKAWFTSNGYRVTAARKAFPWLCPKLVKRIMSRMTDADAKAGKPKDASGPRTLDELDSATRAAVKTSVNLGANFRSLRSEFPDLRECLLRQALSLRPMTRSVDPHSVYPGSVLDASDAGRVKPWSPSGKPNPTEHGARERERRQALKGKTDALLSTIKKPTTLPEPSPEPLRIVRARRDLPTENERRRVRRFATELRRQKTVDDWTEDR